MNTKRLAWHGNKLIFIEYDITKERPLIDVDSDFLIIAERGCVRVEVYVCGFPVMITPEEAANELILRN